MNSYVIDTNKDYDPIASEPVLKSIFEQYEYVIIESLVTSFGLDFLIKDQHGGDVDTIHNVRQVEKDEKMTYKNQRNKEEYDNRGPYNTTSYHSDKRYIEKNREVSRQKENGTLKDAYLGDSIVRNGKSDLDHVISAKEIHDDPGRVLAGIKGEDLANAKENLEPTNQRTNRTKKADSMDTFIDKYGNEYSNSQKDNMKHIDANARKLHNTKIAKAYYTDPKFYKDVSHASAKVGVKMGLREALGLVFTEIWFEVKKEYSKREHNQQFDLGELFKSLGNGIKNGYENAKVKYKTLFSRFISGALAGALSSIITTVCNIFFTSAKNVVKIIRQSYASLVEASKVLFFNPENYTFGERMRAVAKILSTGASVVVGVAISEAVEKTAIGAIPVIGNIVKTFCGSLVTGIMSCTLLYYLDNNKKIKKILESLDDIHTIETEINFYTQQAAYFEGYAAKLMEIDIVKLRQETELYNYIAKSIDDTKTEDELNFIMKNVVKVIGIKIPWSEYKNFDSFMEDKNSVLSFE